jgi:hypothetical protein
MNAATRAVGRDGENDCAIDHLAQRSSVHDSRGATLFQVAQTDPDYRR